MNDTVYETRVAILARMVQRAPNQTLGRTQVMKLFYFLQELKGVFLGYDFTLFTYGPFDSEVLSDLSSACGRGAVTEDTIQYPRGFGYVIAPAEHAEKLSNALHAEHPHTAKMADEVVSEFGSFGAGELELRSTILYVDREAMQLSDTFTNRTLAERVRQIKPHFTEAMILDRISDMSGKDQLGSLLNF